MDSARRFTMHLPARWSWAEQFLAALESQCNVLPPSWATFLAMLRLCAEAGLDQVATIALDGTKMAADAAFD